MIIQSLVELYNTLADRGEILKYGWNPAQISYVLCIDHSGHFIQIIPQLTEVQRRKKTVLIPKSFDLPAAVVRTSGQTPNFLWDKSDYILGIRKYDEKKDSKKTDVSKDSPVLCHEHFEASAKLHHLLLDSVHTPTAEGILNFFDNWDPNDKSLTEQLSEFDGILEGRRIIFRVDGKFAHEDPEIKAAWDKYYQNQDEKAEIMQSLVSGKEGYAEEIHPHINGIRGTKSGGAALVSSNSPAFCSYGKSKNLNAPMERYSAFAYTSALNYLLSDYKKVQHIGNTTVVSWVSSAEPQYAEFSSAVLLGTETPKGLTSNDLRRILSRLAQGLPCEDFNLDPKRPFYILGLAPSSARIIVRFFLHNSFGELMRNVHEHHQRLNIEGPCTKLISITDLLNETVRVKSADDEDKKTSKSNDDPSGSTKKDSNSAMENATVSAIFSGTQYPVSLLTSVMLRIRAERNVNQTRAAIIKAYYLKNTSPLCPKEVLTVSLNKDSTNIPYTLGRLFAVYEKVQHHANPNINTTIKDKFFSSASTNPAAIFPVLNNLCQNHMSKLYAKKRIEYDNLICELTDRLGETYPMRLTLPEQGSFTLGYYHQHYAFIQEKEEKTDGNN